jgi:hypothetical protein
MENVADLAKSDTGLVLKLVLSCLVRMGYQAAFSVLEVRIWLTFTHQLKWSMKFREMKFREIIHFVFCKICMLI